MTLANDHDPLCPTKVGDQLLPDRCWRCDLIAKVRHDERSKVDGCILSYDKGQRDMLAKCTEAMEATRNILASTLATLRALSADTPPADGEHRP